MTKDKRKNGYVYIARNELFPKYIKIGKAINPQNRINSLSVSTPHKFELLFFLFVDNMDAVEKIVHKDLAEYRVNKTEFFKMGSELAQACIIKNKDINKAFVYPANKTVNFKINLSDFSKEELKEINFNNKTIFYGSEIRDSILYKNSRLYEFMRDWFILVDKNSISTDNIVQKNFYNFLSSYLKMRYPDEYLISSENTIDFLINETEVKKQIIVRTPKKINNVLSLKNGYSVIIAEGKADFSKISKQK